MASNGWSVLNRPWTAAEQVQSRWFGHDLSGAPDSGIGHSEDGTTCGGRIGRFGQSTFQPTFPQPVRRKRRAGGRVVTVSDVGLDVGSEGVMWGTPRKRALFGSEVQDSVSSVGDVAEGRSGGRRTTSLRERPGLRGRTWLTWWRAYRREWRSSGQSPDMVAPEGRRFPLSPWVTSTPVPMFAGKTSWDQYRQVFEAIVSSNRWDGVTAALQLVSHLEGDALNVALLVPAPRRVLSGVLLDALTEDYSSPGRLAHNRRQFERVSRMPGDSPSVFAVELETLPMRAFADLNSSARLQLVRDRFIARQCSLR